MDIVADLKADILAYVSPRSAQVETGASQVYGCTAEAIFRLRGEPVTDPRIGWSALVGNGIHAQLAEIRAAVRPGVICEQRFTFKGVPCTVDYIDPAQRLLVDFKTKDDARAIAEIREDGPKPAQIAQIQLGMAAAREAGVDVDQAALLFIPRAGNSLDDAWAWGPIPFDEQAAIDAAEWAADVDALAADPDVDPRDHRGKPVFFCHAYCPYARTCRGEPPKEPVLSEEYEQAAADYLAAKAAGEAAEARKKELRPALLGLNGRAGAYEIKTTGGRPKETEDPDVKSLTEFWQFVNPDRPLPVIKGTKQTPQRLTVKRAEVS